MKSKRTGQLHYYADSDVLHYLVKTGEEFSSREVALGVTLELDAKGKVIGIEILDASRFMRSYVMQQFEPQKAELVKETRPKYGTKR